LKSIWISLNFARVSIAQTGLDCSENLPHKLLFPYSVFRLLFDRSVHVSCWRQYPYEIQYVGINPDDRYFQVYFTFPLQSCLLGNYRHYNSVRHWKEKC
jgi:hypothetical protein